MENIKKETDKNVDKKASQKQEAAVESQSDVKKQGNLSKTNQNNPQQKQNYKSNYKHNRRKKFCKFCAQGIEVVDYKDVETLSKYINYNCKIISKKQSGNCTKHQRRVSNAIKRARIVALLPFISE